MPIDNIEQFEIMFDDLNEEAQKKLLEFYGVSNPEEINPNLTPLAILNKESE